MEKMRFVMLHFLIILFNGLFHLLISKAVLFLCVSKKESFSQIRLVFLELFPFYILFKQRQGNEKWGFIPPICDENVKSENFLGWKI